MIQPFFSTPRPREGGCAEQYARADDNLLAPLRGDEAWGEFVRQSSDIAITTSQELQPKRSASRPASRPSIKRRSSSGKGPPSAMAANLDRFARGEPLDNIALQT